MPPSSAIAIVVPTYNSENTIESCLQSILRQAPIRADEIFVVDGGSRDKTRQIVESLNIPLITTDANRSLQRNRGAHAASSPWILFIDSDMVLKENVVHACVQGIEASSSDLVGAVIPEQSIGTSFWAKTRAFERGFYEDVWWIEAARLVNRDVFLSIGGYDEFLGRIGGEDGDLDSRLRSHGPVVRIAHTVIHHDEGAMNFKKLYLKKRRYGPTLTDDFTARNPHRAQKQLRLLPRLMLFFRKPQKLLRHPLLFAGVLGIGMIEYSVLLMHSRSRQKR